MEKTAVVVLAGSATSGFPSGEEVEAEVGGATLKRLFAGSVYIKLQTFQSVLVADWNREHPGTLWLRLWGKH